MLLRVLTCVLMLMFLAVAVPSQAEAAWWKSVIKGAQWIGVFILGDEITNRWDEATEDDDDDGCYDTCSCSPSGSCHSGCDCTGFPPSDPQTYGDGAHNYYGSMYGSNYGPQYGSY